MITTRNFSNPLALSLVLLFAGTTCRIDNAAPEGTKLTGAPVKELGMVVVGFDSTLLTVAWRPDGHEVFAGGTSTQAAFVNTADGVVLNRFPFGHGPIRSASYSRDGALLAVGGSDFAGVWAIDQNHQAAAVFEIAGAASTPFSVAFSPISDELAVSGSVTQAVTLWSSGGDLVRALNGVAGVCLSPAWSRDGTLIAAVCNGGKTGVWNAATGALLATHSGFNSGKLYSVTWNADSTELAVAGADKKIYVLNVMTGAVLRTFVGQYTPISVVAWHPEKDWLLSTGWDRGNNEHNHLLLWDTVSGKLLRTIVDHGDGSTALAWSLDGKAFATAGLDGTLKIRKASGLQE